MSVTIMARVFWTEIPQLSYNDRGGKRIGVDNKSAKLTLLAIADNADDFGENSWQAFETLAKKTSLERRSVVRVIHALIVNNYCKLNGVSIYGTNDYSINLEKLGNPPKKRTKNGRPAKETSDSGAETSDSGAETSDSGAETSDPESPESPLSILETPIGAPAPNLGLEWQLTHGQDITQHDLDEAALINQAPRMFEKAFGTGTWPWSSNNIWTKFEKFVCEIHRLDPQAFGKYIIWRAGPGKYTGMSNKQIRTNPQIFMDTGWAEFEKSQTDDSSEFHPKYHDPVPPDPNEGKYAPPPKARPHIGGRRTA